MPKQSSLLAAKKYAALVLAVEMAGGRKAFSKLLGLADSTVAHMLYISKHVPLKHVGTVNKKLGIPPHVTRPDLFKSIKQSILDEA